MWVLNQKSLKYWLSVFLIFLFFSELRIVDSISTEGWMLIDGTKVVCIKAPDYDERKSMRVDIKEEVLENEE